MAYKHRMLSLPNPFPKVLSIFRSSLLRLSLTTAGGGGRTYQSKDGRTIKIDPPRGIIQLMLGNGAGYVWGRTLYVAVNLKDMRGGRPRHKVQFGFTQNANIIPYVDGN